MVDHHEIEKDILKRLSIFSHKLELLIVELELSGEVELTDIYFKWQDSFYARQLDIRAIAKKTITKKFMANTQLIPYEG